ncbi:MAG: hypothetical protein CM1200mP26_13820 [Acidimicrobiales bacterium]|nr:MAG: hypothetical protein CM1200mP26_13820 [Acidimicrobiales bacterium]
MQTGATQRCSSTMATSGPGSCAVQRRRVTGGTTTDDHQIMLNQRRTTQAGTGGGSRGHHTCTVNAREGPPPKGGRDDQHSRAHLMTVPVLGSQRDANQKIATIVLVLRRMLVGNPGAPHRPSDHLRVDSTITEPHEAKQPDSDSIVSGRTGVQGHPHRGGHHRCGQPGGDGRVFLVLDPGLSACRKESSAVAQLNGKPE